MNVNTTITTTAATHSHHKQRTRTKMTRKADDSKLIFKLVSLIPSKSRKKDKLLAPFKYIDGRLLCRTLYVFNLLHFNVRART